MSIKPIIAANWKMNKTPNEGIEFFDEIKSNFSGDEDITIIIGTAFTGLNFFYRSTNLQGCTKLSLGAKWSIHW